MHCTLPSNSCSFNIWKLMFIFLIEDNHGKCLILNIVVAGGRLTHAMVNARGYYSYYSWPA